MCRKMALHPKNQTILRPISAKKTVIYRYLHQLYTTKWQPDKVKQSINFGGPPFSQD